MSNEKNEGERPPERRHLTETISRISAQRAEPPGKGIAMIVLAVVVIGAVIWQIATGTGPGREIRERHPEQARPSEGPVDGAGPATDGERPPAPRATPAPPAGVGPRTLDVPRRGAQVEIPEAIGPRTADDLRLSLGALALPPPPLTSPSQLGLAAGALRRLPEVVAQAPEAERDAVRTVALEQLEALVERTDIGGRALDAAQRIAGGDAAKAGKVLGVTLQTALLEDATAPAAVLFVRSLGREASAEAALRKVVADGYRPLHVRVLAAQALAAWGVALPEDALEPALAEALERMGAGR